MRHWLDWHCYSIKIENAADVIVLMSHEEANVARARIAEQEAHKWVQEIGCNLVCAHCGQGSGEGRMSLERHVWAEYVRIALSLFYLGTDDNVDVE